MTVKELRELLAEIEDDRIVVMSKDAEGNGYSPLSDTWNGKYQATTTWYGDVGLEELDDELRSQGYTEEDLRPDGVPALILCPVN